MKMAAETSIGIILLGILAIFLNPSHLFMPDTVNTMLMLSLIIGFLLFVALIWREQASDERDNLHIQKSGRLSFFVGATILVMGIVYQAIHHDIDPWLLYSLSAMVVTKLASRVFHHFRN